MPTHLKHPSAATRVPARQRFRREARHQVATGHPPAAAVAAVVRTASDWHYPPPPVMPPRIPLACLSVVFFER